MVQKCVLITISILMYRLAIASYIKAHGYIILLILNYSSSGIGTNLLFSL